MDRYINQMPSTIESSSSTINNEHVVVQSQVSSGQKNIEVDIENLPSDPGLRPHIMSYPHNLIEQVRRTYLLKGPCQPREHNFPQKIDGDRKRKFVVTWFDEFKDWLEYSIIKDAAFCLYCYLFSTRRNERGHDAFVSRGFNGWRKKERLREHVGDHNSHHNKCRLACQNLMNQGQHIEVSFPKVSKQSRIDYRCRLNASIDCLRYLIMQGLAFGGDDDSEESLNQKNVIDLLNVIASCNEDINNAVLKNAPENLSLTSPMIQKDIINAVAVETTNAIIKDLGNDFFSILVGECCDVSTREQMGVVIRFVNKDGCVIERFLGLVHMSDTTAASLEKSIDSLFSSWGLSICSLRGQGYDGASNMRGEFNGLKNLILKKNSSAYFVHCFAHQLQLALVAVSEKNTSIGSFFNTVTRVCNVIGGSCKPTEMIRDVQMEKVVQGIAIDQIKIGKGLDQEMTLKQPRDTRWSSHYGTLINLIHLFSSVSKVLEQVGENGNDSSQRAEAIDLLEIMSQFEFVFVLLLMRKILGITHELSQVLQRKDRDIVNAMNLVKVSKVRLEAMRDDGWENLLSEVSEFSSDHEIVLVNMEDHYAPRGRSRRNAEKVTNLHHYRFELFNNVIDAQIEELNHCFDEVNTELLLCMACFDPREEFVAFDKLKVLRLANFYPSEFSPIDVYELDSQLDNFILDVRLDERFTEINGIGGLAQKMVATRKHMVFPWVYLLIKLLLILPVATPTVERASSAMKIIKSSLRNRMGDKLLNDCLVTYIENDVFFKVSNDAVVEQFQNMKNRR